MLSLPHCICLLAGLFFATLAATSCPAAVPASATVLTIDGLGKGAAPLEGPWQFHLGDNPVWAAPSTPDTTGTDGWEQLSTR